MEDRGRETITAFDTLLTTNHIQMMKVILSYLAPEQQNGLAVYIKFSELQYALRLLQNTPRQPIIRGHRTILSPQSLFDGSLLRGDNSGVLELLDELMPYGGPQERARLQNIRNLLTSISQMRQMIDMMEMMKDLFPEGMGSGDGGDFGNFASMFSDMAGMGNMTGMSGSSDTDSTGTGSSDTGSSNTNSTDTNSTNTNSTDMNSTDMNSGTAGVGMDPAAILQMLQMFQSLQSSSTDKPEETQSP